VGSVTGSRRCSLTVVGICANSVFRDEVLYQAKIHPEQYSNTFNDQQIIDLHDALIGVCTLACETLADTSKFPETCKSPASVSQSSSNFIITGLMKHRWNKGKKDANVLPNGDKIIHLKVGGRTSAVVPNVQKKTGPVAGDVPSQDQPDDDSEADEEAEDVKPKVKKGRKSATNGTAEPAPAAAKRGRKQVVKSYKEEEESDADEGAEEPEVEAPSKKRKSASKKDSAEKTPKKPKTVKSEVKEETGRRRSGRGTAE
jgi:formamidopyrimidine-DNA glycosylase